MKVDDACVWFKRGTVYRRNVEASTMTGDPMRGYKASASCVCVDENGKISVSKVGTNPIGIASNLN